MYSSVISNSPNKAYHLIQAFKLKGLNVDKLRAEYQSLETQKKELTATYKNCEIEVRNLKRKQENLNQYLGRTQTDPVQEQQTKNKITAYKTIGGESGKSALPICNYSQILYQFLAFTQNLKRSRGCRTI